MSGIKTAKLLLSTRIGGEWHAHMPPVMESGTGDHSRAFADGHENPHNPTELVSDYRLGGHPIAVLSELQDTLLSNFGVSTSITAKDELLITQANYKVLRDDNDFQRQTNPNAHSRRRHESAPTTLLAQAYAAAGIPAPAKGV